MKRKAQPNYDFTIRLARLRCSMFRSHFDSLERHVERVEDLLYRERSEFDKEVTATLKTMSPERGSEYAEDAAKEAHHIAEFSPRAFRAAAFIHVFSEFENFLHVVADGMRHDLKLKKSVLDVKHRGIRRSAHYLAHEAGLKFPSASKEWKQILQLAELRNALAHNGGEFPRDAAKAAVIRGVISGWPELLSVDPDRRLFLDESFVPECLQIFQRFIGRLQPIL